ncbi:lipid-A-disaccharide synthase-related protein [Ancylothrix sp. C2]|uniref:lipid-A-disaccharide synthase-related protein n=1 Tax=Ancylothrix sp. D3o TaxID=2953691 RepID=UPI0021BB2778|nr:lipid-A-disaccharide synthase-related protein [Ancylothrix sp. D3o]MCT7950871.1 lipid-A-disaccharide synthase-related protein [Ancylothrix sp. D3o]
MKLLCLSNGHGEDAIAVRILRQLQGLSSSPQLAVLPLVGEGYAYRQLDEVEVIGPVKQMPSGGFIYMDGRQLWQDVQGGLLQLTFRQFKTIQAWGKEGGIILAVGDIVPLLFAWLSGANYMFVGTAKSEYYLQDESGPLPRKTWFEKFEAWWGSVYLPWERWLMKSPRCKGVFPRDSLTAKQLEKFAIPAYDLGNPMMDDLEVEKSAVFYDVDVEFAELTRPLVVVLLPGSREPEAYRNWQKILISVAGLCDKFAEKNLVFLVPVATSLNVDVLSEELRGAGWQENEKVGVLKSDELAIEFCWKNARVVLSQKAFGECLQKADMGVAMAGTATEQLVGLGKPVFTFAGVGPQFTAAFAEAQSRLLGPSVILLENPQEIGEAVGKLLRDPDRLVLINKNGRQRMGEAGAARRIAECLIQKSLT